MRSDMGARAAFLAGRLRLAVLGGRREAVDPRLRCGAVLLLDRRPDLVAGEGDGRRPPGPEPHVPPADLHDRDGDVVAEADALSGLTGDDEHVPSLACPCP